MEEELKNIEEELLGGQSSKILTPVGESVWEDDGTDVTPKNSRNVAIPDGKNIVSLTEKGDTVESENQISNSDFTLWTETPDGWEIDLFRSEVVKTEDSDTGDYALQFAEAGDDASEIEQRVTVTPEETYTPSARVKDGDVIFAVYYNGEGDSQLYYQFSGDNVGTWVQSGLESTSVYTCVGGEGIYATCSPTAFEIPAGVESVVLRFLSIEQAKIDNVSLKNEAEEEQVVNGGFENWTEIFPEGFIADNLGDEGGDGACEKEETEYHSSPYSAKITQGVDAPSFIFAGVLGGLQEGNSGKITFYAKAGTANDLKVMLWNGWEDFKMYAFTGENAGNWTVFNDDIFADENFYKSFTLTNEWVKYEIEAPGEGENFIPVIFASETPGGTFYIDDMEGYIVSAELVDYHSLKIRENALATTPGDALLNIKSADNYSLFRIGARGKITSEAVASWDFENKPVKVGWNGIPANNPSENALNGYTGSKYYFKVELDLKVTDEVDLSVGKDGYRFMPTMVVAETISADSLSGDAQFYLADKTDFLVPIVYSTSLNKCRQANLTNTDFAISGSGKPLRIVRNVVDSGTSGVIAVYIFGTLIKEEIQNNQQ